MTLASRLSTAANLGMMDSRSGLWTIIVDNMLITQLQSTVVGLLAAVIAYVLALVQSMHFLQMHNAVVLCSSSVITSILVNITLSILMIAVVCMSRKLNLNPDNIATPVAASLGDLITISILAFVASFFHETIEELFYVQIGFILFIVAIIPLWMHLCHRNPSVSDVIKQSWVPIISAMVISSMGGLILDKAQKGFKTFAAFSPVICGIGGNLVAIQASRICTYLHAHNSRGNSMHYKTLSNESSDDSGNGHKSESTSCEDAEQTWSQVNRRLLTTFNCNSNPHYKSAVVLLALVVPGDLLFVALQTKVSSLNLPVLFYAIFCFVSFLQVLILLIVADWVVHVIWKLGDDPDNCSIPYLTAFSDLLGTGLLLLGYLALASAADNYDRTI
ncbi:solute carrier family 41 member 1-like [Convolutriloba macropyga]|uniref:solute carrier family 41 member 1-like n=1 Tax=Convolutriloba macropyga TaxID=536237 RepID=UPI003F520991